MQVRGDDLVANETKLARSPLFALDFWRTLASLLTSRQAVLTTIDIPLADAFRRSRSFTTWATLLLAIGLCAGHPVDIHRSETWLKTVAGLAGTVAQTTNSLVWLVFALVAVVAYATATVILYGLLRLYTLLHHVLTLNVFKTRGQRLRLLNVETTLLVLSVPIALAIALWPYTEVTAVVVLIAATVYGLWALGNAYNHIFHQHGLRGLWLLLEGTVLTWFVLCVVAIAVAAAIGVVVLIIVLILRGFVHTHP